MASGQRRTSQVFFYAEQRLKLIHDTPIHGGMQCNNEDKALRLFLKLSQVGIKTRCCISKLYQHREE